MSDQIATLCTLFLINIVAILFIYIFFSQDILEDYYANRPEYKEAVRAAAENNILRHLGAYPNPGDKLFDNEHNPHYVDAYYGIKKNEAYCDIVDMANLINPERVYSNMVFFTDYHSTGLPRQLVMNYIGKIGNEEVNMHMSKPRVQQYEMNPKNTFFFTKKQDVHDHFEVGKEMACASQMYGHVPGHHPLVQKEGNVKMINEFAKRFEGKPHCFEFNFPRSYRLNNEQECKEFFAELRSDAYRERRKTEPVTYIIKVGHGAHRARGLDIFDEEKEVEVKQHYGDGEYCGQISESIVAQYYISNPMVLDLQNKFDFRIYMLIGSVNPLIAYYHDGFLRTSLQKFDKYSKDPSIHFANTHLSKEIFKIANETGSYNGMNEEELRDYQMWTMEELQTYLLEVGIIKDPNWLDNYLRPQFKKAFMYLSRMIHPYLLHSSSVFEMFGIDFVIDENQKIWFIECNPSPQLIGTSPAKTTFLRTLLKDMFYIEHAFLKSRWKRIVDVIQRYYEAGGQTNDNQEFWRNELKEAMKNRIDPEFKITTPSSWYPIIDANLKGKDAYFDMVEEECILEEEKNI